MQLNGLYQEIQKLIELNNKKMKYQNNYIFYAGKNLDIGQEISTIKETVNNIKNNPDLLEGLEEQLSNLENKINLIEEQQGQQADFNIDNLQRQITKNAEDIIYILQLLQFNIRGSGYGNQLDSMLLDNAVLV